MLSYEILCNKMNMKICFQCTQVYIFMIKFNLCNFITKCQVNKCMSLVKIQQQIYTRYKIKYIVYILRHMNFVLVIYYQIKLRDSHKEFNTFTKNSYFVIDKKRINEYSLIIKC